MNIKEYIYKHNLTLHDLAAQTDISYAYLTSISNGHLKPSKKLAARLMRVTNGEISIEPSDVWDKKRIEIAKKKQSVVPLCACCKQRLNSEWTHDEFESMAS